MGWECAEEPFIPLTRSEACLMETREKNVTGGIYLKLCTCVLMCRTLWAPELHNTTWSGGVFSHFPTEKTGFPQFPVSNAVIFVKTFGLYE